MQINKAKHLIRIWEDSGWRFKRLLKTLQSGKILFQVPKQVLRKKEVKTHRKTYLRVPGVLLCAPCVQNSAEKHCFCTDTWGAPPYARGACTCASGWKTIFCCFSPTGLRKKAKFFGPNPLENHPINTTPLIHNHSLRKRSSSRENEALGALREESLVTLSLYGMFYYFVFSYHE